MAERCDCDRSQKKTTGRCPLCDRSPFGAQAWPVHHEGEHYHAMCLLGMQETLLEFKELTLLSIIRACGWDEEKHGNNGISIADHIRDRLGEPRLASDW